VLIGHYGPSTNPIARHGKAYSLWEIALRVVHVHRFLCG